MKLAISGRICLIRLYLILRLQSCPKLDFKRNAQAKIHVL